MNTNNRYIPESLKEMKRAASCRKFNIGALASMPTAASATMTPAAGSKSFSLLQHDKEDISCEPQELRDAGVAVTVTGTSTAAPFKNSTHKRQESVLEFFQAAAAAPSSASSSPKGRPSDAPNKRRMSMGGQAPGNPCERNERRSVMMKRQISCRDLMGTGGPPRRSKSMDGSAMDVSMGMSNRNGNGTPSRGSLLKRQASVMDLKPGRSAVTAMEGAMGMSLSLMDATQHVPNSANNTRPNRRMSLRDSNPQAPNEMAQRRSIMMKRQGSTLDLTASPAPPRKSRSLDGAAMDGAMGMSLSLSTSNSHLMTDCTSNPKLERSIRNIHTTATGPSPAGAASLSTSLHNSSRTRRASLRGNDTDMMGPLPGPPPKARLPPRSRTTGSTNFDSAGSTDSSHELTGPMPVVVRPGAPSPGRITRSRTIGSANSQMGSTRSSRRPSLSLSTSNHATAIAASPSPRATPRGMRTSSLLERKRLLQQKSRPSLDNVDFSDADDDDISIDLTVSDTDPIASTCTKNVPHRSTMTSVQSDPTKSPKRRSMNSSISMPQQRRRRPSTPSQKPRRRVPRCRSYDHSAFCTPRRSAPSRSSVMKELQNSIGNLSIGSIDDLSIDDTVTYDFDKKPKKKPDMVKKTANRTRSKIRRSNSNLEELLNASSRHSLQNQQAIPSTPKKKKLPPRSKTFDSSVLGGLKTLAMGPINSFKKKHNATTTKEQDEEKDSPEEPESVPKVVRPKSRSFASNVDAGESSSGLKDAKTKRKSSKRSKSRDREPGHPLSGSLAVKGESSPKPLSSSPASSRGRPKQSKEKSKRSSSRDYPRETTAAVEQSKPSRSKSTHRDASGSRGRSKESKSMVQADMEDRTEKTVSPKSKSTRSRSSMRGSGSGTSGGSGGKRSKKSSSSDKKRQSTSDKVASSSTANETGRSAVKKSKSKSSSRASRSRSSSRDPSMKTKNAPGLSQDMEEGPRTPLRKGRRESRSSHAFPNGKDSTKVEATPSTIQKEIEQTLALPVETSFHQREVAECWTCTCGETPSKDSQSCGACGASQFWTCSKCNGAGNLCFFVFCSLCGSHKAGEGLKDQMGPLRSPSSVMSTST